MRFKYDQLASPKDDKTRDVNFTTTKHYLSIHLKSSYAKKGQSNSILKTPTNFNYLLNILSPFCTYLLQNSKKTEYISMSLY